MSETWYVVPAALALRNVARDGDHEEARSTWILPEAWRKAADPRSGVTQNGQQPKTPLAPRSNS